MAFICRKPFTFKGTHYRPGDVVSGFPDEFFRSEGFLRTGFIVEEASRVAPEPKKSRKSAKSVVEDSAPVEVAPVAEEVAEEAQPVEVVPVAEEATVVAEDSADQ